jgi:hypothetical protein
MNTPMNISTPSIEMLRPFLRQKGVPWVRTALKRYGVRRFGDMTDSQLAALSEELNDVRQAQAYAVGARAFVRAFVQAGGIFPAFDEAYGTLPPR